MSKTSQHNAESTKSQKQLNHPRIVGTYFYRLPHNLLRNRTNKFRDHSLTTSN